MLIEELRALLRPSNKKEAPAAAEITSAAVRASEDLRETEDRLRHLKRDRADVLLLESAEKLKAHEDAIRETERDVERLREIIPRLRERAAEAQENEAVASVPDLAAALPAAVAAVQAAQRAFHDAQAELSRILGPLRSALGIATRARRVHELPDLDEALEADVNRAAHTRLSVEPGASLEWPRPPAARTDKHVVVHGDGRFSFVGEWSDFERRDWIRRHGGIGPRRLPHPAETVQLAAQPSGQDAAAALRIQVAGVSTADYERRVRAAARDSDDPAPAASGPALSDDTTAARILRAGKEPQ